MWVKSRTGGLINTDKLTCITCAYGEVCGYGTPDSEGYSVLFAGSDDECEHYVDSLLTVLNQERTELHRLTESLSGICSILDTGVILVAKAPGSE